MFNKMFNKHPIFDEVVSRLGHPSEIMERVEIEFFAEQHNIELNESRLESIGGNSFEGEAVALVIERLGATLISDEEVVEKGHKLNFEL